MSNAQPPHYVGMALGITSQDWSQLGLGDDPSVAASPDIDVNAERIVSLLLIRIVAWIQPSRTFTDLSTTTLCRQILLQPDLWPQSLTPEITEQLKVYVKNILSGYNSVPYHNFEHCYHVTISCSKLLDMIVHPVPGETPPNTYGLRDDPLMQLALVFSALIHDVEHQGIPNRQLANEDDALAVQYNDQSIAENLSLYIGFSELLKSEYNKLRTVLFPEKQDYRRFRAGVVNLVLTTDIASPERSQIGKSKWKEAFGDPYETVERKVIKLAEKKAAGRATRPSKASRRMSAHSIMSELSLDSRGRAPTEDDLEDDESVTETPDTSDNEEELKTDDTTGAPVFRPPQTVGDESPAFRAPPRSKSADLHGSMRKTGKRRGSKGGLSVDSEHSNVSGMALKFHRRLSSIGQGTSASNSKKYTPRLGLLRTVDLSGQALETYSGQNTRTSATGGTSVGVTPSEMVAPPEEIDELRESVVMETIMKAADVAHNLQGYDHMVKYSNRLFLELKRAFVQGRGDDPQDGWYPNQIGFIDAYLLPLARKLDDTGIFGDTRGAVFEQNVEASKERWTKHGMSVTANIIQEAHKQYPEPDSGDEDMG